MFKHTISKRVRYGETDKMGYLYYGNYANYYEIGRVEMLRALGITYKAMEDEHGIWMPVMSLNIRYIRPAYYDDLLIIETTLRALPAEHILFHVEIYNESNQLLNGGQVKLCFFEPTTQTTIPAPEFLVHALRPYFEDEAKSS